MITHRLRSGTPRPFFAEIPYYLWGQVSYDSDGDCTSPTDRSWTWLVLTNRETRERLEITSQEDTWEVSGEDPCAARTALFLASRCGGEWISPPPSEQVRESDHEAAIARAVRVQAEFEKPELRPFDAGDLFWGSWKWVGWFATEFTWVGRWIMHSVVTNDARAVNLCVDWLRDGTVAEQQSQALRYALGRLTGRSFATDKEWVEWYEMGGGVARYPEPNLEQWYAELNAQVVLAGPGAAPDRGGR